MSEKENELRKISRISGHECKAAKNGSLWVIETHCDCGHGGPSLLRAKGRTLKAAARRMVEVIYHFHGLLVMEAQNWACAECGRHGPLEIHHLTPRSRGRNDRIENLRALCASGTGCDAHRRAHGRS